MAVFISSLSENYCFSVVTIGSSVFRKTTVTKVIFESLVGDGPRSTCPTILRKCFTRPSSHQITCFARIHHYETVVNAISALKIKERLSQLLCSHSVPSGPVSSA